MNQTGLFNPHIARNVWWVFAAIGIFLLGSALFTEWLARKNREKSYAEVRSRIRTWVILVGMIGQALVMDKMFSLAFFALISFLSLKEYLSLIPTRRVDRRVLFWAYLSIPLQYFWAYRQWYGMFIVFIPVYMFLLVPFRILMTRQKPFEPHEGEAEDTHAITKGFLRAVGTVHWGMMLLVFCLSHIGYLLVLPPVDAKPAGGPGLVLMLLLMTELNDVAQYVWGKSFGKHKVVPEVSPNKTVEGLLGGILTTTVLCVMLAPILSPFSFVHSLILGPVISMAGFFGDITVSALKRDLGIKDTGSILPGHGGVLDRVDSLTYTAPLFFHFVHYFYYW
jgi:phosphatidate cytidylyltransferase